MNRVMLPAAALLNADSTPFRFGQEATLGKSLGEFLGKNHVSVGNVKEYSKRAL